MRTIITYCFPGSVKKRNLRLSSLFATLCCSIALFFSTTGIAQTPADCVQGCTSNDVQIKAAYLSTQAGVKLGSGFVCPQSGSANVYLTLELTTNTPRIGVSIFTNVKALDANGNPTGNPIASPNECFGIALNQPTNKVTFQTPFNWQCGTAIALTDVFIAWGTGNKNFCTGSAFQCPATPSKCYQLPGDKFIAIETPTPQNQTVTQCSDTKGGTTSTFNLNNVTVTSSSNVTITWWENYTSPSTFSNQINSPGSYSSGSKVVYAKITSNSDASVFSVATVTLVVNQTPNLAITNPAAVCSPATVDITASSVTNGSTIPSNASLTYYLDNSGSPGTQITNSAAQSLGAGTYWIKAATNTTPSCSDQKQVTVTVNQTPAAPILSKVDNCNGTTTITAKDASNNVLSASELTWSNGATTNPISVTTTTTVTATRTVNSCTGASSNIITPAPKTTPAAPVLSKEDNCNGTTTITAKDASNNVLNASELTWSNGATTNPISVSTTTPVTCTRTVGGCTSGNSNIITPAPGSAPNAPAVTYNAPACDQTTFSITITNVATGVTYVVKDKNGANIAGVAPGNSVTAANTGNIIFSNIPAGSGYQVTATLSSCSSTTTSCGTASGSTVKVVQSNNLVLADGSGLQVKAYPNPFNDKVKFVVNAPIAGDGSLEVYNMLGQKLKTIYQGHITTGNQSFELTVPKKQQSTLIYVFKVGDKQITGKLLQLNN